ncbi:hypothetical protein NSQ54_10410 [Alkalihalobacillus sp. FSL W8-0930]
MSNRASSKNKALTKEDLVEAKAVIQTEPEPVQPNEPKYHIIQLREHCREAFGVNPEVFDGALFDCKDLQITKTDARKRVDEFLARDLSKEAKA